MTKKLTRDELVRVAEEAWRRRERIDDVAEEVAEALGVELAEPEPELPERVALYRFAAGQAYIAERWEAYHGRSDRAALVVNGGEFEPLAQAMVDLFNASRRPVDVEALARDLYNAGPGRPDRPWSEIGSVRCTWRAVACRAVGLLRPPEGGTS